MRLTGTLRRQTEHYHLEEQLSYESDHDGGWTIPRLYCLCDMDTTHGTLLDHVDTLVLLTGIPRYDADRHAVCVALDSVEISPIAR